MGAFLSFVVCLAVTAGLGLAAYRQSQAHHMRRATRLAGLALVPFGLELAGVIKLGRKIGDAFGHWAVHLVFDPLVWIGFIMLGLAALVWIVTGFSGEDDDETAAVSNTPRRAVGPSKQKTSSASSTHEDPEIEAILRKHGVS